MLRLFGFLRVWSRNFNRFPRIHEFERMFHQHFGIADPLAPSEFLGYLILQTLVQRSHSPNFPAGRWAFKELAFGVFDERRVRVFLDRDDSLQFNSTWDAQIDHQDGGGVLEIIGSLLSIANIAVCESRGNSHGCCLSIMCKCVCVGVYNMYPCMYMCVSLFVFMYILCIGMWSVRAHGIYYNEYRRAALRQWRGKQSSNGNLPIWSRRFDTAPPTDF